MHLIVVDPGVGTTRRALLLEALGQHFVAPDNGVLSMIAARDGNWKAYEITNPALWASPRSSTFHGHDLFAPAAAAIASGADTPEHVGPRLREIVLLRDLNARQIEPGLWRGLVLSIDHFGNVITNLPASSFASVSNSDFMLELGRNKISQFCKTFGDAPPNVCFAYFGSSGYVEIGINQRSAAELSGVEPGDPAYLRLGAALESN